ncbi:RDD family protein [Patescibacteria group bacterium]|nr:RDD family protein [Patescibacteria group bacterium]
MDEPAQNEKPQVPQSPLSFIGQPSSNSQPSAPSIQPIQPDKPIAPSKPLPPPPWRMHPPHSILVGSELPKDPQSEFASFVTRLLACFVDCLIVTFISGIIAYAIISISNALVNSYGGMDKAVTKNIAQIPAILLGSAYFIYFTGSSGQTLGKKMVKIKVVKKGTATPPSYTSAFLREIVGKMISAIILGLGFLWVIGDKEKQAWHDKIAGTVVVKVE